MFAVLATPPLEPPFLPVSFDRKTTAFGAFFFVAMAKSLLLPFISCGYPISSHTFLTIMPIFTLMGIPKMGQPYLILL